jgi:hypothetical protein
VSPSAWAVAGLVASLLAARVPAAHHPPSSRDPQHAGDTSLQPAGPSGDSLVALVDQALASERTGLARMGSLDLAVSLSRRLTTIQALAAATALPAVEYLVALRRDGTTLWQRRGEPGYVRIPPEADAALYEAGAGLLLLHNHPTSVSLSLADLENLAKPGVWAMIVVAHDSSVYMAERGIRYDPIRLPGSLYGIARRTAIDQLDRDRPSSRLTAATIDAHLDHLVVTALHEAGVLRYQAILALQRRRTYGDQRRIFSRAIEAARGRVRAALR